MKRSIVGFLILVAISGYLFFTGLMEAILGGSWAIAPLGLGAIGLILGYYYEWIAVRDAKESPLGPGDARLLLSVIGGGMASYYLNIEIGLGAVVAAGLVSILAALLFPKYAAAMTSGAFVGMASAKVLPGAVYFLLASALAGLLFVLAKDVMNGLGGKLGAMAASGGFAAAFLIKSQIPTAGVIPWSTGKWIVLWSFLAAEAAYIVSVKFKHGAMMGSGIVSVVAGLVLPVIYPDIGATLAVACACASYVGMSAPSRIPDNGLLGVAGVLMGLVFVWGAPAIPGVGGRLGTTALGSVIAVWGFLQAYKKMVKGPEQEGAK